MRGATGEQAEKHGIQLRDYIVLSAVDKTPNVTQGELGKALGLDKTTLMSQLDRLERMGLVVRRSDPRDRRARIRKSPSPETPCARKWPAPAPASRQRSLTDFSQDQVKSSGACSSKSSETGKTGILPVTPPTHKAKISWRPRSPVPLESQVLGMRGGRHRCRTICALGPPKSAELTLSK